MIGNQNGGGHSECSLENRNQETRSQESNTHDIIHFYWGSERRGTWEQSWATLLNTDSWAGMPVRAFWFQKLSQRNTRRAGGVQRGIRRLLDTTPAQLMGRRIRQVPSPNGRLFAPHDRPRNDSTAPPFQRPVHWDLEPTRADRRNANAAGTQVRPRSAHAHMGRRLKASDGRITGSSREIPPRPSRRARVRQRYPKRREIRVPVRHRWTAPAAPVGPLQRPESPTPGHTLSAHPKEKRRPSAHRGSLAPRTPQRHKDLTHT